jgi:hypothetical protein
MKQAARSLRWVRCCAWEWRRCCWAPRCGRARVRRLRRRAYSLPRGDGAGRHRRHPQRRRCPAAVAPGPLHRLSPPDAVGAGQCGPHDPADAHQCVCRVPRAGPRLRVCSPRRAATGCPELAPPGTRGQAPRREGAAGQTRPPPRPPPPRAASQHLDWRCSVWLRRSIRRSRCHSLSCSLNWRSPPAPVNASRLSSTARQLSHP